MLSNVWLCARQSMKSGAETTLRVRPSFGLFS
jgi:hypothetical protein